MGYYPQVSEKTNLNQTIINLLSQAPSNSKLGNMLVAFREQYVNSVDHYFMNINYGGIDFHKIRKTIPADCIVTQSDKNVGISVLTPSWYAKEYQAQISKGGYEKIDLLEEQCLKVLNIKIHGFQKKHSGKNSKILAKFWPRKKHTKNRIGVLKLVPKVIILKNNISQVIFPLGTQNNWRNKIRFLENFEKSTNTWG